jgi:hypothetical protein
MKSVVKTAPMASPLKIKIFSAVTVFSLGWSSQSLGGALKCGEVFQEGASKSAREQIVEYTGSKEYRGFLFDSDAQKAAQKIIAIAASSKSGDDFVRSVKAILAFKSGAYMGGLADNNFNDLVLPGLLQASYKFHLTPENQQQIMADLTSYSASPYVWSATKDKVVSLTHEVWGDNRFLKTISEGSKNRGDLKSEILGIVASAKNGDDFVDAFNAVLSFKANKYWGGIKDNEFNEFVFPAMLQASHRYTLSAENQLAISEALTNYSKSSNVWSISKEFIASYNHEVWGDNRFLKEMTAVYDKKDRNFEQEVLKIASGAKNGDEFVAAVVAALGFKANRYWGGLGDNEYNKVVLTGLLKISHSYELSLSNQNEITRSLVNYSNSKNVWSFSKDLILRFSRQAWGK